MTFRFVLNCHYFKNSFCQRLYVFLRILYAAFPVPLTSPQKKMETKTIDDSKPKKKPALAMKKPAALATEGKGIKKDECMKKPAAKSLSKQSSGERQPYLVLFYRPSGKCAIRQNYGGAKKQLFQFGGKGFDENDLRNIAKTAIANIINNTLDETSVRQFVDDEVSKLVRDVD